MSAINGAEAAVRQAAVRPVRASTGAVLGIVAVAQFMVVLDASIVNVALPSIQRDVGFSEQSLSWVLNAYTLLFGGFLLLGGRAADRLGRRRLFMAGGARVFRAAPPLGVWRAGGGGACSPRAPGPWRGGGAAPAAGGL